MYKGCCPERGRAWEDEHSPCTSLRKDQALLLSSCALGVHPQAAFQDRMYPLDMATSPQPLTTKVASSENSSAFYDYEYYWDQAAFMPCMKGEVLAFAKVFLPVFYSLVFVLGLSGNLLLLVVLLRYVPRRRMTEVYLLNLAISNLLFVVTLPFWIITVAWHWVFGNFLCKMMSTLYTINLYSGIFFISCMSLDKYLQIVHAQPHHRLRTRTKRWLLAVIVWAVSLAVSIPDMVFVRIHENHEGVWTCHADFGGHGTVWKLILRFQQNILGFILPLFAMIFFYSRIGSALVRLRPPGQGRALKVAVSLVVAFFVLWFPYNLTLFLHSLMDLKVFGDCKTSNYLDYALQVTESIAFLHCCFTPILYAFSIRCFCQYLKAFLAELFGRHQGPCPAQAPLSSYCESSSLTVQEMTSMNDLEEGQSEDSPNKGAVGGYKASAAMPQSDESGGDPAQLGIHPTSSLQGPQ